jgi:hypothetical protein
LCECVQVVSNVNHDTIAEFTYAPKRINPVRTRRRILILMRLYLMTTMMMKMMMASGKIWVMRRRRVENRPRDKAGNMFGHRTSFFSS